MKSKQQNLEKRILVIRNRHIGDTVLAIPFLRNLRRKYPDAIIDVVVEHGAGQILEDCPYKNELLVWNRPKCINGAVLNSFVSIISMARWIRRRRYNQAFILNRSLSTGLLAWLAGIPHRVGAVRDGRGMFLTHKVPLQKGRHEVELSLDLLRAEGITVDDGYNENWVSESSGRKVDQLLESIPPEKPRVFMSPKSSDSVRNWRTPYMAEVLRWLIEEFGCEVFLCGSLADLDMHQQLQQILDSNVASHVHDLSQKYSLGEASALLSQMDCCIGVDTGLPHVAASFGVPIVKICGQTDQRQWRPWKTQSVLVQPTNRSNAVVDVTMDQVITAIQQLFHKADVCKKASRRSIKTPELRPDMHTKKGMERLKVEKKKRGR